MISMRYVVVRAALCAVILSSVAATASATPFPLTVKNPDISAPVAFSYDAGTQIFTATASPTPGTFNALDKDGNPFTITNATYSLLASIDNAGVLLGPGSMQINGDIGSGVQAILNVTLTDFYFASPGSGLGLFEFFSDVNYSAIPGFGKHGGITMASSDIFPGAWSFTSNFAGTSTTDNFRPAPEPATLMLFLLGGVEIARRRYRKVSLDT